MRKAVIHLKRSDPVMRAIIERIGPCRMQFGPPEFHSLAEAIVYQQLNGKAAVTIFKRFAALAGELGLAGRIGHRGRRSARTRA